VITFHAAGGDVVGLLKELGYCPLKVSQQPLAVSIMSAWVQGRFSKEDVKRSLENIEIMSGKSLRPEQEN
jgi:hypothetical protein